jgi:hypothetical protein
MFLNPALLASMWSLGFEAVAFGTLWLIYRKDSYIYFNPQDFAKARPDANLPEYSKGANFDGFITQYTGMAKVIIGLAAASISFGGLNRIDAYVLTAKMLLAFSIAYALIFCITVINFYENYLHDLKSYGPFKCALVESCGLTALFCFTLGYGYWAWHL